MDILIRKLQEKDVAQLTSLEQQIFTMPWSENSFAGLLTREYCKYLVALDADRVIGFAGMTVSFQEADIDKVMVDPAYRRQGIAHKLLETLFRLGDTLEITAYTLEVRVGNTAAISLYEKEGFVSEGIRPRFYEKPVEDAMIMWRRL